MGMPATVEASTSSSTVDAPITLATPAPKLLGLRDTLGLWGNLGISLLLPVAATFVILPGSPFGPTFLAIVVGAVIGSVLLGLGAAAGAREGVPAMVLLRGLLGRRTSYLPTVLQPGPVRRLGHLRDRHHRGGGGPAAGRAAVAVPARGGPARHADGAAAAAFGPGARAVRAVGGPGRVSCTCSCRCSPTRCRTSPPAAPRRSGPPPTSSSRCRSRGSRWPPTTPVMSAMDGRPSPVRRSGYGMATIAFFMLGTLALAAYGAAGFDVIDALLAVPLGAAALLVLVFVEVDEAFANIYSTAVSAQNLAARLDRQSARGHRRRGLHAARVHHRHHRV